MGKLDLIVIQIEVERTDQELLQILRKATKTVSESEVGGYLTISGYDLDPREIWDIPECKSLLRRVYDMGFMSVLDPGLDPSKAKDHAGLTAMNLWCIIRGMDLRKDLTITKNLLGEFEKDLRESNRRCDANCKNQKDRPPSERELDGIHFIEYNTGTAEEYAKKWRDDLLKDRVLCALDIRDKIAYQLAKGADPNANLKNMITRHNRAQMIPTVWTVIPRSLMLPLLKETGMMIAKQALDDMPLQPGHCWFFGFTAGGCAVKQVRI